MKTKEGDKKLVVLSNLAMRFYERDGWTENELKSLMVKGELALPRKEDGKNGYFLLEVGGAFDVKKLANRISEVKHFFNDHKKDSLEKIIKEFNW